MFAARAAARRGGREPGESAQEYRERKEREAREDIAEQGELQVRAEADAEAAAVTLKK
eukprot:COSAG04_NODE_31511_length_256_cov_0.961783_1_plen_57_part_10